MTFVNPLHTQALKLSQKLRQCEKDLIEILQKTEAQGLFKSLGYNSLFQYCVESLKLSESQTYDLITVARKSKEIPSLKTALAEGEITLTKARRISSVITPQNQKQWIQKAKTLPKASADK